MKLAVVLSLILIGCAPHAPQGDPRTEEYKVTDTHDVISYASRDRNPNQQNLWQFTNHEAAIKKLHELLYYRVYNHYVRNQPK